MCARQSGLGPRGAQQMLPKLLGVYQTERIFGMIMEDFLCPFQVTLSWRRWRGSDLTVGFTSLSLFLSLALSSLMRWGVHEINQGAQGGEQTPPKAPFWGEKRAPFQVTKKPTLKPPSKWLENPFPPVQGEPPPPPWHALTTLNKLLLCGAPMLVSPPPSLPPPLSQLNFKLLLLTNTRSFCSSPDVSPPPLLP